MRKPGTERRRNGRASLGLEFVAAAFGIGYLAVLMMLTLANTVGIVMLLLIAKALSRDNKVETEPV